ncbi:1-acylglycerol-3-phosphate acyltransferase [Lichtheimia corymbifera JMRC:FSU:9682]|uniref:1-acyl-sn-glycerol-3-phosphate acyltransferase n=1 Tax=Lichtheimia corymbifera JMRC:FSU:9682 TaxID=1263082 RepID=A0A068RHE3_9FUNG|nr:1-acylglycerol-3-phosphate acyltransferase [Lichtheimia corymbifera JMRC:FSU:9682]
MREGTALTRRVHWAVWAVMPTVLSALLRKRGGFYYRTTASLVCLAAIALYGVLASLTLPLVGKAHLINWSVARLYYHIAGYFTGMSATIEGKEHIRPERPSVYVCNHQTSMDVLFMASVFPKATAVVAKKSIKYYPFLGWYMTLSRAIFLDRKNRNNAIKEARHAAENIHKKKTSVFLFPEGTRGHASKLDLLPFKKGAFYMAVQARVPVVPIVIANYNHLYDSAAKRFLPGNVRIKVLPPVDTTNVQEDSESVDALANNVRDMMLTTLKEISIPPPSSLPPPPSSSASLPSSSDESRKSQ